MAWCRLILVSRPRERHLVLVLAALWNAMECYCNVHNYYSLHTSDPAYVRIRDAEARVHKRKHWRVGKDVLFSSHGESEDLCEGCCGGSVWEWLFRALADVVAVRVQSSWTKWGWWVLQLCKIACLLNVLLIPDLPGHCDRRWANGLVTDDFFFAHGLWIMIKCTSSQPIIRDKAGYMYVTMHLATLKGVWLMGLKMYAWQTIYSRSK